MKETIKLNGKDIKLKELTFNAVCQLEDFGVPLGEIEAKTMSFMRGYIAICMNAKPEDAGREIEAHVVNGGSLVEISDALKEAVEGSGFFQAMGKKAEAETAPAKAKK